ncbi:MULTISPECIES: sensor histidine kinase [Streptomyces]|uniref:sensor histidine kinase n=1 Tax=Streptomyces TaxID=1883 RepID=UPI0006AFCA3B|nr:MULTISPECIES: histidine kinase [unclassified Streptomyces]KOU18397.1 histidine kinase [Streptomyces sp. WM6349]KOU97179.1 histidine kinase [Streptomyces sp. XY511]KOV50575.1 histidine kinase [Streptomyces sp. H036]QNE28636.1 two-component sensor histidine kinase [Streptomyces sp. INR7]RST15799.1 two-component sensor histidine kinase [Streptomyces sp. WAC05950]
MDFAAAFTRDPQAAPYPVRCDASAAAVFAVLAAVLALTVDDGRAPDALGWALLLAAHVPLAWRRRAPMPVLLAMVACVLPYHALDYMHLAPIPASMTALYTVASTGRPRRTLFVGLSVTSVTLTIQVFVNPHEMVELLRVSGWVIAMLVFGASIRLYRQLVAGVMERAEREAERKVAEERLRIARDLHDLLAHSITLIGVQTSVAAHVLVADPDRLDREALVKALDGITETCREARSEVRTTLDVLRATPEGPLPDLASLPDLVRTSGADLTVRTGAAKVPAAVGAAAYRIVQESLTNAVRHGAPGADLSVDVGLEKDVLTVRVTNGGSAPGGTGGSGYGILGMRERARSVGGTLSAGPRDGGGFEVAAELPLPGREVTV